jgi:hypothetical protein
MAWQMDSAFAKLKNMTAGTLFARLRRRPFVPFRLILSSGTTYDILHPEMLFVSKSGLTVANLRQKSAAIS